MDKKEIGVLVSAMIAMVVLLGIGDHAHGQSFTETRTNQLTVTGPTTGTKTATPYAPISSTQTWNSATTVFPGVTYSFTDTASAATSNLFTVSSGAAGTTSRFTIDKSGFSSLSSPAGHAIGAASRNDVGLFMSGTIDTTGLVKTAMGQLMLSTIITDTTRSAHGINLIPTIPRATSGVHAFFSALSIDASGIANTGGAATVTNAYALFIPGAPTGGLTNYGIHSTGTTRLIGSLLLPSLGTSSAVTTGTLCWTTGTGNVNVDTTTTCLLSSAKYKQAEKPLSIGLKEVLALRPVSYQLRDDYNPTGLGEQVGFFAEDVARVDPRLVSFDSDDGTPHAVRYQQMSALLAKAIQEQHRIYSRKIADLERRLQKIEQGSGTTPARLRPVALQ